MVCFFFFGVVVSPHFYYFYLTNSSIDKNVILVMRKSLPVGFVRKILVKMYFHKEKPQV